MGLRAVVVGVFHVLALHPHARVGLQAEGEHRDADEEDGGASYNLQHTPGRIFISDVRPDG